MAKTTSFSHMSLCMACLLLFITCAMCVFSSHPHICKALFTTWVLSHSPMALSITCFLSLALVCKALCNCLLLPPCYVIDFCCTEGEGNTAVTAEALNKFMSTIRSVNESNLLFQRKIVLRSGIGKESYVPARLIARAEDVNMEDARAETENLISIAAKRLLQKVAVDATDIDIVIITSGLFNPSPSLSAFLVNILKMRSNVKSYNLAGMGCSAGLLAIDLAKHLLKVHKNSYALVVSTENITSNIYFGNNDRSMMVSNALFRCGCAAILLSSKLSSYSHAKLQLLHCVRTHIGSDQKAFQCAQHLEDDEGKPGVSLQVNLIEVASTALRANITKLAPSILPLDELLKVLVSRVKRDFLNMAVKVYEPNFKKAIDHFCIHPGGRAVIDAIGKGLKLSGNDIEPGEMALNRFGNTSSSGIWYALAYCEAKGRLKKGDKVWQIALGSGFKCNSGVWRVLRNIEPWECVGCNPWMSSIHRYPTTTT